MVSGTGSLLAEFRAPVWAPYPQPPQGAEVLAYIWSYIVAVPEHSTALSDNANVVKQAGLPRSEMLFGEKSLFWSFPPPVPRSYFVV